MNAPSTDATRVEGTPTGGSGTGANWTADLTHKAPHSAVSSKRRALEGRRAVPYSRRTMARPRVFDEAPHVAEPLITRDEVVALLVNVSDIVVGVDAIVHLLEGGDDEEEEEADRD